MGYTHYWRLKPTILPTEAVLLLGELLWHAYNKGVVQYEFDDPQPPQVSDTERRFKGVGEQGSRRSISWRLETRRYAPKFCSPHACAHAAVANG